MAAGVSVSHLSLAKAEGLEGGGQECPGDWVRGSGKGFGETGGLEDGGGREWLVVAMPQALTTSRTQGSALKQYIPGYAS